MVTVHRYVPPSDDICPRDAHRDGSDGDLHMRRVRRVQLVFNPGAGRGIADPSALRALLRRHGVEAEIAWAGAQGSGALPAREAVLGGCDAVIAAGGDGTVHEVAQELYGTDVALGILPLGVMNNIARCLHIPDDLDAACAVIAAGERRALDIGLVNGQPFVEVVSVGLEAPFFALEEALRHRGLRGVLRATVRGMRLLAESRPFTCVVEADGVRECVRAWGISICNTACYGWGRSPAPDARPDDGLLDVRVLRAPDFRRIWRLRAPVAARRTRRAGSLRVMTTSAVPVAADGRPVLPGTTPLVVEVAAHGVTVLAPPAARELSRVPPWRWPFGRMLGALQAVPRSRVHGGGLTRSAMERKG